MKNYFSRLLYVFKKSGVEEYIVNGPNFQYLLTQIEIVCKISNKRFGAYIGRNGKAKLQIIHPLVMLDSNHFNFTKKEERIAEAFGFGLIVSLFEINEMKKKKIREVFTKNGFPFIKMTSDEESIFAYGLEDKNRVSYATKEILSILEDETLAGNLNVHFYYWSEAKRINFKS